jgi:hypothetical protein
MKRDTLFGYLADLVGGKADSVDGSRECVDVSLPDGGHVLFLRGDETCGHCWVAEVFDARGQVVPENGMVSAIPNDLRDIVVLRVWAGGILAGLRGDETEFPRMMENLARRLDGAVADAFGVWGHGIDVKLSRGRVLTVSPGEMGPTDPKGYWLVSVYDDSSGITHSHISRIPNTCRDEERIVTWVQGFRVGVE